MKEERMSRLGLPEDVVLGTPYLFAKGNHSLSIENHKGIVDFSPNCIKIRYNKGYILVTGSYMEIVSYSLEEIVLKGNLDGISYYNE